MGHSLIVTMPDSPQNERTCWLWKSARFKTQWTNKQTKWRGRISSLPEWMLNQLNTCAMMVMGAIGRNTNKRAKMKKTNFLTAGVKAHPTKHKCGADSRKYSTTTRNTQSIITLYVCPQTRFIEFDALWALWAEDKRETTLRDQSLRADSPSKIKCVNRAAATTWRRSGSTEIPGRWFAQHSWNKNSHEITLLC